MWKSPVGSRDVNIVLKGSGALHSLPGVARRPSGSHGPGSTSHLRWGSHHSRLRLARHRM